MGKGDTYDSRFDSSDDDIRTGAYGISVDEEMPFGLDDDDSGIDSEEFSASGKRTEASGHKKQWKHTLDEDDEDDVTDTLSVRPGDFVVEPKNFLKNEPSVAHFREAIERNTRVKILNILGRNEMTAFMEKSPYDQQKLGDVFDQVSERSDMNESWGKIIDTRSAYTGGFKKIGEGGFGKVYLTQDAKTKKKMVIKLVKPLSEKLLARLKNEAIALSHVHSRAKLKGYTLRRLGKEGIPGLKNSESQMLIETEYIDGKDLREFFSEDTLFIEGFKNLLKSQEPLYKKNIPLSFRLMASHMDSINNIYIESHDKVFGELPEDAELSTDDMHLILEEILTELGEVKDESDFDDVSEYDEYITRCLYQFRDRNVIDILSQACEGIHQAHKKGILHRDIKPMNMMISKEGKVTIIDWGLIKKAEETSKDEKTGSRKIKAGLPIATQMSTAGYMVGTPRYLAPEIIEGVEDGEKYSVQSDVWAMGISLAVLLTGMVPFDGVTVRDMIENIVEHDNTNLKKMRKQLKESPMLWWIIERALMKDRDERFENMGDMQLSLDIYNAIASWDDFRDFLIMYSHQEKSMPEEGDSEKALQKELYDIFTELQELHVKKKGNYLDEIMEKGKKSITLAKKLEVLQRRNSR